MIDIALYFCLSHTNITFSLSFLLCFTSRAHFHGFTSGQVEKNSFFCVCLISESRNVYIPQGHRAAGFTLPELKTKFKFVVPLTALVDWFLLNSLTGTIFNEISLVVYGIVIRI